MNVFDDGGLRQRQQVVVALHVPRPVLEARAAIARLIELVTLDHRTHGAIEQHDALLEELAQRGDASGARGHAGLDQETARRAATCGLTPSA